MTSFFRSVAAASPYLALSSARGSGRPAPRSILVSPPTNPFSGLRAALRQRNNPYLGFLAAATVLADVCLPVTLSHVPFSLVETFDTSWCAPGSASPSSSAPAAAVAASFFIRWPHMPVDPRTVAGALYYVCDSHMLDTALDGMARATKRERNRVLALARPRRPLRLWRDDGHERQAAHRCRRGADLSLPRAARTAIPPISLMHN